MKKIIFAAAAVLALSSGAALAAPGATVTAKISAAVSQPAKVIASNAATGAISWLCTGDSCEARLDATPSVRHCQALAQKVGEVSAFADFDAQKLARCNTVAARVATTQSASAK